MLPPPILSLVYHIFGKSSRKRKDRVHDAVLLRRSDLFFNLGSLTDSLANVVQLCTSDFTDANDVYLLNVRRVDGESLLNTTTVRNTSYSKGFGNTAAVLSDNGSFEKLDSFAVTLFDTVVYP